MASYGQLWLSLPQGPESGEMMSNPCPTIMLLYANKILFWFHTSREKWNSNLNDILALEKNKPEVVDSF